MQIQKFFLKFKSSLSGISEDQVLKNRIHFGTNVITEKRREHVFVLFLKQLGGFFSIILTLSAFVLYLLREYTDLTIVLGVLFFNALIETAQKYKSDSIFEALTKMLPRNTLVVRDSKRTVIDGSEVVCGDVIILYAGDQVPSDALVVYSENCTVNESILTGEFFPASKNKLEEYDLSLVMNNKGILFSGTHIVSGEVHALVYQVGSDTQIGKIAQKISIIDTELPLFKKIKKLSFQIAVFTFFVTLFILGVGLSQGQAFHDVLKVTVALFVSAIPESLPLMITLIFAYGFKRMADKGVLMRKVHSLEALGQIDILALDKTGTITQNQMKVEKIYTPNGIEVYVSGDGYEPVGQIIHDNKPMHVQDHDDVYQVIRSVVLSSTGSHGYNTESEKWVLETGDPTEVAMLVLGQKASITKEKLHTDITFIKSRPFDIHKKYHESVYEQDGLNINFITGAPEIILQMSSHIYKNGEIVPQSDDVYNELHSQIKVYSLQGYRVIATCFQKENQVVFLGFLALTDSIRLDVGDAVKEIYQRGINIIMITGDHKEIALQIAQKIGIHANSQSILTGEDMQNMNDAQLSNIILQKNIFSRMTPSQKLKILELLKKAGKVVAMTGDGVNDSLALKKADIGIAMGAVSSDIAKQASDIVLLTDSFKNIVYGVEEGKNIFLNIRKTIMFLLSTNFAEIFIVVFALVLSLQTPLAPASILWINVVTDTFLVMGFAFERNTRISGKNQTFITKRDWLRIFFLGISMTLIALIVYISTMQYGLQYAQSLTLLSLIVMQWFNVLNIRAGNYSFFSVKQKINVVLYGGFGISVLLTIFAFENSFMRELLNIQPITLSNWLYVILISSTIFIFEEARKFLSE